MMNLVRILAASALLVISTSPANAESVQLASCPEEPDVIGKYYNNGEVCVRDMIVVDREMVQVACPPEYTYQTGWCRRRFHRKVKPSCGEGGDWQLFLGSKGECHSPCPKNYAGSYGQCVLRRDTLAPKYMACPAVDDEGNIQHRYGAYCCSQERGNCPQPECKIGDDVPGKFYYNAATQTCERQAVALARSSMPLMYSRLGSEAAERYNGKPLCPVDKILVRNGCQDPCPDGYSTLKGKCELRPCTFDTRNDIILKCPEGTYKLPHSVI
jgi:hypothetical protein